MSAWPVFAAGGASYPAAPIDRSDYASLQRGAAAFVGYCVGCHSAEYVRYGRLAEDLKIPETLLRERLMPGGVSFGDGILSAMRREDAEGWFYQAAPPDLSLSAKLHGEEWLYAYLHGFYRDAERPSGWNNTVVSNVAMPHVLAGLQGEQVVGEDGGLVAAVGGRLSAAEYDLLVSDLVNFLGYIADPARPQRHRAGYLIISFLLVLFVFTYFLYREYWRDISH